MDVLATKTAPRCKLCQHAARPEIDALLLARSQRKKDESNKPINLAYVLAKLGEMGVENPTEENVKNHWKEHCEVVSAADLAERESMVAEVFERILGPGWEDRVLSPDEIARLFGTLSVHEAFRRAKSGEKIGITPDHGLKAVAESTKRRSDDRVHDLLGTLVGATGEALKSLSGAPERRALDAGEVEGELVAEDADYEAGVDER